MESFFLDNKDIANFKIPIFLSFTVSFSIFWCRHWKTAAIFEFNFVLLYYYKVSMYQVSC